MDLTETDVAVCEALRDMARCFSDEGLRPVADPSAREDRFPAKIYERTQQTYRMIAARDLLKKGTRG